jgi:uncharacterized membrane-anchored protein YitT (DUF2179 family)
MQKNLCIWIKQTFFLVLGSALCAVAVKTILVPQGFLSTGLTGAALIFYYRFPDLPVEVLYLIINFPVFLLGWRLVSLRFVLYSLWGMAIYSLMLHLMNFQVSLADPLLAAILAGALSGIGVAIILRSFGSTGGSEILSVILYKLFSLSVGAGSAVINGLVLGASALLFPIETVLYAVVYAVVSMLTIDKVFYGLSGRKAALIISSKWPELVNELTMEGKDGVTKINGIGGYQGLEKTILY